MEIRFAFPEDVPQILCLLRQTGQFYHSAKPDLFRVDAQKYSASQVLTMLNKPQTPVFVAVEENTVLGYCFCQIKTYYRDSMIVDHTSCHIEDLCVEESRCGTDVGKTLYEAVYRYAKERKCHSVTCNVYSCDRGAVKFWEAMGMTAQYVGMESLLEEDNA